MPRIEAKNKRPMDKDEQNPEVPIEEAKLEEEATKEVHEDELREKLGFTN